MILCLKTKPPRATPELSEPTCVNDAGKTKASTRPRRENRTGASIWRNPSGETSNQRYKVVSPQVISWFLNHRNYGYIDIYASINFVAPLLTCQACICVCADVRAYLWIHADTHAPKICTCETEGAKSRHS